MSKANHTEFFNRDGTSQQQRCLAEIDPLFAKVDDRQFKDLLSFLWKMAEHLQYYDLSNTKSGNWQDYVGVERAVLLSLVATTDTSPMNYAFLDLYNEIRETNVGTAYLPLFDALQGDFATLKELQSKTSRILGRELFLSQLNVRRLEAFVASLAGLYLEYAALPDAEYTETLAAICGDLGIDYATAPVNTLPTRPGKVFDDRIRADLYELHQSLQQLFATVIGHADQLLADALSRKGDYHPHIGLILTFLQLFKKYQDQLNDLTAKHLDFYYQDVLQINYRDKIADKVNVIIQLAKHADLWNLAEGAMFKAGKDSAGKELLYRATEDFVANKALIADLKSVYRAKDNLTDDGEATQIPGTNIDFHSLRAAAKADSLDGKGEALDEENPQFPPFGDSTIDYAQAGFAFASPLLRLAGGTRIITFLLTLKEKAGTDTALQALLDTPAILDDLFEVKLSCEKGWESIVKPGPEDGDVDPEIIVVSKEGDDKLKVTLTLGADFPAIVDFSTETHAEAFPEKWPVCKLLLKQTGAVSYYELCRRFKLKGYTLDVDVSDLNALVLQNDFGLQKPDKPMQIFGAQPKANAKFYIGSPEVFSKKLSSLTVKWDWIEYKTYAERASWYTGYTGFPANAAADVEVAFERLVDNRWEPLAADQSSLLFRSTGSADTASFTLEHGASPNKFDDVSAFKKYEIGQQDGFVRIRLLDNGFLFGHHKYHDALLAPVQSTFDGATITTTPPKINRPLAPSIENVRVSYTSTVDHLDGDDVQTLYHLHPFGYSTHAVDPEDDEIDVDLVPNYAEEASLYIAIDGLKPPQNLSMLFQFIEGTGNLNVDMPDEIEWSYLAKSGWVPFDERGVIKDGTRDFSGTGIVSLALPKEAVTDAPLMPQSQHWVRASVKERSRAVNLLAAITPQAMELEFFDQDNAPDHYAAALSAGKIGKLQESVAQVKAVTQPFASYGGRAREDRKSYHVRVSERLRHKDRAITLWDYERLVLENFPQIHKVKCLNHMSEKADIHPGHVRVVVIPTLENLNAVNILQPAVSISLRDEITEFLEARCSKLVRLDVCNPRYEHLQVGADVTFRDGLDVGYHNALLSDDIRDFLTPWKSNHQQIHFYEKLHSSVILNFIEEREYVDYLTDFSVVKTVAGQPSESVVLGDITRTRPDSLFVSAEKHLVNQQPQGIAP